MVVESETRSREEHGRIVDELTAHGVRGQEGEWSITLYEEAMTVTNDAESFVHTREQIAADAKVMFFADPFLVLPGWKNGLKLDPKAMDRLRRWMGPELTKWGTTEALRVSSSSLVIGVACVAAWWFLGGWFLLALGAMLIGTGIAQKVKPGPWLLAASAARTTVVCLILGIDMFLGTISWWWALLVVLFVFSVRATLRKYRFFARPLNDPTED